MSDRVTEWLSKVAPNEPVLLENLPTEVDALLIPCNGAPKVVKLNVLPTKSVVTKKKPSDDEESDDDDDDKYVEILAQGDGYLQSSAMTLLCDQPGCQEYKHARSVKAAIERHVEMLVGGGRRNGLPGGYAMILDGYRPMTQKPSVAALFLGADNGDPAGRELMKTLQPNKNLGNGIVGPVIVYTFKWTEPYGAEHEAVFSIPKDFKSYMRDIKEDIVEGILGRYDDMGIEEVEEEIEMPKKRAKSSR